MLTTFGSHFRHNVVAYLALFFALGGTAIAARPLITGTDVQDGSLTGADISDASTLKGVDIDESDLGKVPSALNADNVANADKLDGMDSSRLARFGAVVTPNAFDDAVIVEGTGGFTVEGIGGALYKVSFPSGTFSGCHKPIATATAQSGGGAPIIASILPHSELFIGQPDCGDDGSAIFYVHIQNATTGDSSKTRWWFTAM